MQKILKLKIKERAFNTSFIKIWQDKSFFIVMKGSGGSGKSEDCALKILLRMLLEDGHRFYGIRKVGKTIRKSQWALLKDQIARYNLGKLFRARETDMELTCRVNGNTWTALGMDDREKIKSLTEPTGFWIEEATELSEDDLDQLVIRMRGYTKNYKQILMSFNPIDEFHWLRARFFPEDIEQIIKKKMFAVLKKEIVIDKKTIEVNALVSHTTFMDNKFLTDEDKARLVMYKTINPHHYKIYALGEWGVVEGRVYPKGYLIIEKENYPKDYDEIIYGLDFGFVDPTSLSRYYLRTRNGILESYCEELLYEKGLDTEALISRMKELNIHPADPIYADSSAAEKINKIQEVYENGVYLFNILSSDKNVKEGIDFLRTVRRYSCPENINHNREIKNYRLRMDSKGRYIDGEPIKYMDHTQDEERYALFTHKKQPSLKMAFINEVSN